MLDILIALADFIISWVNSIIWLATDFIPSAVTAVMSTVGYLPDFLIPLFVTSVSAIVSFAIIRLF